MKRFFLLIAALTTISFVNLRADVTGTKSLANHPLLGTGTCCRGAVYVLFDLVGFSGTIDNVTYSSITKLLPITTNHPDARLNAIPYTVTGGALNVAEVK